MKKIKIKKLKRVALIPPSASWSSIILNGEYVSFSCIYDTVGEIIKSFENYLHFDNFMQPFTIELEREGGPITFLTVSENFVYFEELTDSADSKKLNLYQFTDKFTIYDFMNSLLSSINTNVEKWVKYDYLGVTFTTIIDIEEELEKEEYQKELIRLVKNYISRLSKEITKAKITYTEKYNENIEEE